MSQSVPPKENPSSPSPSPAVVSRSLAWRSLSVAAFGVASLAIGVGLAPHIRGAWERLDTQTSGASQ